MIIKSIFIEQFGGLKNFFMEFNEGFNQINAENEYGKSTIAEFIKIMLYGTGKSVRDIRENERLKFMPWGEKKMSGEITVLSDNTEYTIIRTFGTRKSSDTIRAIYTLTGKDAEHLEVDSPGEVLLGIGPEAFGKSLYVKQLSNKISAETDDEILSRLINLAQSGEEETSFGATDKLLETAEKEIAGTRPKGKLLLLKEEIAACYAKKSDILSSISEHNALREKIAVLKEKQRTLKETNTDSVFDEKLSELARLRAEAELDQKNQSKGKLLLFIQLAISLCLAGCVVFFFNPYFALIPILWTILCIFFLFKKGKPTESIDFAAEENKIKLEAESKRKENLEKIINISEEISAAEQKISDFSVCSVSDIDRQIGELNALYLEYEDKHSRISLARRALREAFDELQRSFGPQLNEATAKVISKITNGKYTEVFVDETYEMSVRSSETGEIIKAQYLSGGAYDQIYFALRMAITGLLFKDLPIILDEPFAQYDKTREEYAMEFLKELDTNQIILFTH